jgi:hypothetical protein
MDKKPSTYVVAGDITPNRCTVVSVHAREEDAYDAVAREQQRVFLWQGEIPATVGVRAHHFDNEAWSH